MNDELIDISESSDSELLKMFDCPRKVRSDDAAAMQTCLCILLTAAFIAAFFAFPELTGNLIQRIKELSASQNELFPNPIKYIERLF